MVWCGYYYYDNCSSAWYQWGRWVLLGVAIAVALFAVACLRWYSMFQVRKGHRAMIGTTWMMPPSYQQSQQQHYGSSAAPPYNPDVGDNDAGYYDEHGNFVAKPRFGDPEAGAGFTTSPPPPQAAAVSSNQYENYPPPNVHHPSQTSASDYYPPPEGPPPVARP